MKKIAVLLMFVAFASFITGCSLSGKSRDAAGLDALTSSLVPFTVNSVIDGTLSGNLRGSKTYTRAEVKAMTIEIDGKTLVFDEIINENPLEVSFKANIPAVELVKIVEKSAIAPIEMVVKAAGVEIKKFEITLPKEVATTEKAKPILTISNTGDIEVKIVVETSSGATTTTTKPVTSTETTTGKPPVVDLAASIEVKSSTTSTYYEFTSKMTLGYNNPTFKIELTNGSTPYALTNGTANFNLVIKNDKDTTLDLNETLGAEATAFHSDDFGVFIDRANGTLTVTLKRTLTDGKYNISIPQLVIKSGENQARLKSLNYEFTINAAD